MSKKSQTSGNRPPDAAGVKRLTVEAIASDAFLAERLVFKGGSALEILYGIEVRASVDLDFSIEGDFKESDLAMVEARFRDTLAQTFGRIGVWVFDIQFAPKPAHVSADLAAFWGGYGLKFKLIAVDVAADLGDDIDVLRRNAMTVGPEQRKTFEIDISRHELCRDRETHSMGGMPLQAYSPRLIVAEKIRAICQQMPEYRRRVRSPGGRPRARDFFDIFNLIDRFSLILTTPDFAELVARVFEAKRVPLSLLGKVEETREFHRTDFQSVLDTVPPGAQVLTFDEYFDRALSLIKQLQALGNKQPPLIDE